MNQPHCVIVDGHNFMHRARAGFQLGDHHIVFNFFRNLRALVELLKPTSMVFTLEGHPRHRYELQQDYKANRRIVIPEDPAELSEEDQKRIKDMKDFFRQKDEIVPLLKSSFPIAVVRHPHFEADDLIYNLIKRSSTAVPWTVVSNDSDFTQLLCEFNHVTVYNPMKKENFVKPSYDYVSWKALRGDASDNIPGLPGITDEFAESIVNDPDELQKLFESKENADAFSRNYELIKFATWSEDESMLMESSRPKNDWSLVSERFDAWGFKSLLKDKSWEKFTSTFDTMWGAGATCGT